MRMENSFGMGGWPSRRRRGGDVDLDGHAEVVGWKAGPGAVQRQDVPVVPGDGDADQVAGADDPVGRVEFHPAGAGQVDPQPGMGRATADMAIPLWDIEVARDEA